MLRKLLTGVCLLAVLVLTLILGACGAKAAAGTSSIAPTWVTPVVNGDNVSVPLATVQQDTMVHFWVETPDGKESFMAYQYGGATYMRADVCVPCRSIEFSLQGDILVCDSCGTTFSAATGKGVSGACKAYPKVDVKYELTNGNLVASVDVLKTAYYNTVNKIG